MASRISVEVLGNSVSLQEAAAKAGDSLKQLAGVVARQTDVTLAAGEKTVRMNELVAKSYQGAATKAGLASEQTIRAFERQGAVALDTSRLQVKASERTTTAAKVSTGEQVTASNQVAAASRRSADTQVASAARTARAFGASSSELTKFGKNVTFSLLGAAAASAYLAVKFQANTLRLETQAGATSKQLDQLRKGILGMAAAVGETPNQLANGMYHVVSSMNAVLPAAHRVRDELHILRIAAEGAQVGHSNLEQTTYTLVSAMNALHQGGGQAAHTMGVLNAVVGSGDMTMNDLLDALKSGLIPTANTFHVSLQSLGAALAVMGDMGMQGALAGTRLRMSLALLGSPSAKAAKELQTIGLSAHQSIADTDAMSKALEKAGLRTTQMSADLKKPNGLQYALRDLNQHLRQSGLTATGAAALISSAFGGGRSGAAIALMAENTGRLDTKFHQIGHTAGQFGHDWQLASHTAAFELKSFEAGVISLATSLGTDLLPIIGTGVHDLSDMVHWFERGSTAAHLLEIGIGTLATVAIGSYLVSRLTAAIKLMREFGSVVASPASALGRLGTATRPGGAGVAGGLTGGGLGIGGARSGYGLPGSVANPIIVAMEAGEFAGLGSMGAAGTVATEQKVAAAETGAAAAVTGGGTAAATGGVAAAEGAGVAGLLTSLKSGLGALLKGAGIAGMGSLFSQLAGGVIGGKAGHATSTIGTGASIGAGLGSFLGPEGTLAGGVLGGLVGAFVEFNKNDASKYGQEMAKQYTAPLGPAVARQFDKKLADQTNKLQSGKVDRGSLVATITRDQVQVQRLLAMGDKAGAATMEGYIKGLQAKLGTANQAVQNLANQQGATAGHAFVKGLAGVKLISTPLFLTDMRMQLNQLPAAAQPAAAKVMLEFAHGLEKSGKLPKGAVDTMLGDLKKSIPGFGNYLYQQGIVSDQSFSRSLKFTASTAALQRTISDYRTQFGNLFLATDITGKNIDANVKVAMETLQHQVLNSTGAARHGYESELDLIQQKTNTTFSTMVSQVTRSMAGMSDAIQAGSQSAASIAGTDFAKVQVAIEGAMSSGVISTARGVKLIQQNLNAALKAFGAKPIPLAALVASTGGIGPGTAAHGGTHAVGGYVGNPGEKGRDQIPIVVGRGEAILNHPQQAIANRWMAPIGGLPGLFAKTAGSKHYMAGGGYAGGGFTNVIASAESLGGNGYMSNPISPYGYSELGIPPTAANIGTALGRLPYKTPMRIRAGSHEVVAAKQDIGTGSTNGGNPPAMGLYPGTVGQLGLSGGMFHVSIERADGAPLTAGAGASIAGAVAAAWKNLTAPKVSGEGTIPTTVRAAMKLATDAANKLGAQKAAAASAASAAAGIGSAAAGIGLGGGATSGPGGLAVFEGVTMSQWIANELAWGTRHGWHGQPTSGYRPGIDPHTSSGRSEHALIAYPGGAVDFGGPVDPAAYATKLALVQLAARLNYPGPRLQMPTFQYNAGAIGGADDGHLSGNGLAGGGFVGMAGGGILKGYDDVDPTKIPKDAQFAFSYADIPGAMGTLAKLFPHIPKLSFARSASVTADILDAEPGLAEPNQAPGWARRMQSAGKFPRIYGGARNGPKDGFPGWGLAAQHFMRQAGFKDSEFGLMDADYDGNPTIPAPFQAKQYLGWPNGGSPGPYDVVSATQAFLDGAAAGAGTGAGVGSASQSTKAGGTTKVVKGTTGKAVKPTKAKLPKIKPPHFPKIGTLKLPAGLKSKAIDSLIGLQATDGNLTNWYGYLQQLYGDPSIAQPTISITNPDGTTTDTINWGSPDPGTPLSAMTGLVDPSTGKQTKGIYDWVRDIGTPPSADSTLNPPMTFLGVEVAQENVDSKMGTAAAIGEADLDYWTTRQKALAALDTIAVGWLQNALDPQFPLETLTKKQLAEVFNGSSVKIPQGKSGDYDTMAYTESQAAYVDQKVEQYKDMIATIARLEQRKKDLPEERAARDLQITDRFAKYRLDLSKLSLGKKFDASSWLSNATGDLSAEERDAKAGISKKAPAGWVGSKAGWSAQRGSELAAITSEFAARKLALESQARAAKFQGQVSKLTASAHLAEEERHEKAAVSLKFGELSQSLATSIAGDRSVETGDRSYLTSVKSGVSKHLSGINTNLGSTTLNLGTSLSDITNPQGPFQIALLELGGITIPGLIGDIASLTGTTVSPSAAGAGTASSATLIALLQQENAILAETVALGTAQTSVLAGMIPEIPMYEKGGPVLEDGLIYAHAGEHVVPAGGSLVMGGNSSPDVHLHQHLHGDMVGLARFIDQRIQHPDNVRAVSRGIGQRTSLFRGAPGGFR